MRYDQTNEVRTGNVTRISAVQIPTGSHTRRAARFDSQTRRRVSIPLLAQSESSRPEARDKAEARWPRTFFFNGESERCLNLMESGSQFAHFYFDTNILDTPSSFRHNRVMEHKPTTLLEAIKAYADIDFALGESADSRWPKGVSCAHCGADSPMFLKTRKIWKCSRCRKQFSFKAGTVFEDSPIGLDKWLPAVWIIANARNGVSSHELGRSIGVTQKTAWFMLHRVRLAMQDDLTGGMLNGEVEVDESYIGGKVRNMHKSRKLKVQREANSQKGDKAIVLGILERASEKKNKRVRATVVPDRKKNTMQAEVAGVVDAVLKSILTSSAINGAWMTDSLTRWLTTWRPTLMDRSTRTGWRTSGRF
jgi:transposase-like protein